MPVSDHDIRRQAHLWVQQYGNLALAKAREMLETTRNQGDHDGAEVWLRIIVVIGTRGEPPTAAKG